MWGEGQLGLRAVRVGDLREVRRESDGPGVDTSIIPRGEERERLAPMCSLWGEMSLSARPHHQRGLPWRQL